MTPLERLQAKSKAEGDCVVWTGSRMWSGYGVIYANGKQRRVHRLSYLLQVGDIPEGLHVLHRCDNRACINPKHLFLGNHIDNMQDKARKGRAYARATSGVVKEMRAAKGVTQNELAERYGLAQSTVHAILTYKTWRHVA